NGRHARESGHPGARGGKHNTMDSRVRGNDETIFAQLFIVFLTHHTRAAGAAMAELIEDPFIYRAIVGRHSGSEVLLVAGPQGWTLPHGTTRDHHPSEVADLCRALQAQLGVDATVLRCLHAAADGTTASRVFELEVHGDSRPLPGVRWFRRSEVD